MPVKTIARSGNRPVPGWLTSFIPDTVFRMRAVWQLLAAALIAVSAFGAGIFYDRMRTEQQLRASACSARHWNPTSGEFEEISLDPRDCLRLGPERTVTGVWIDHAYGGRFQPAGISEHWTNSVDLSLNGLQRAKIRWLANKEQPPYSLFSARSYDVTVKGRVGRYTGHPTDATAYVFVVDDVLKASLRATPN